VKRTNLRTNPEDAEYFKRFRDRTMSMVGSGMGAEQAVAKLVEQGVPEQTAQRIVRAVVQELSLGKAEPAPFLTPVWWASILGASVFGVAAWFVYSSVTTGAAVLSPKLVVKVVGLLVVIGVLLGGLARGRGGNSGYGA
jgi:hypothetical protein